MRKIIFEEQKHMFKVETTKGTPTSLLETIERLVDDPVKALLLHAAVSDFLSQHFQRELFTTKDPLLEATLLRLFRGIVK